jgi:hypothetical protein
VASALGPGFRQDDGRCVFSVLPDPPPFTGEGDRRSRWRGRPHAPACAERTPHPALRATSRRGRTPSSGDHKGRRQVVPHRQKTYPRPRHPHYPPLTCPRRTESRTNDARVGIGWSAGRRAPGPNPAGRAAPQPSRQQTPGGSCDGPADGQAPGHTGARTGLSGNVRGSPRGSGSAGSEPRSGDAASGRPEARRR